MKIWNVHGVMWGREFLSKGDGGLVAGYPLTRISEKGDSGSWRALRYGFDQGFSS
jgi:hypothetical protein